MHDRLFPLASWRLAEIDMAAFVREVAAAVVARRAKFGASIDAVLREVGDMSADMPRAEFIERMAQAFDKMEASNGPDR